MVQEVNAQTGISYTILESDQGKLVTFSYALPVTVTLPQATEIFGDGFSFSAQNLGAGIVTLTSAKSDINGSSSLTLAQGESASFAE